MASSAGYSGTRLLRLSDLPWEDHTSWWDRAQVPVKAYLVAVYRVKGPPVYYNGDWDHDQPATGPYQVWLNDKYRREHAGRTCLDALTAQCVLNEFINYPERYAHERVDK